MHGRGRRPRWALLGGHGLGQAGFEGTKPRKIIPSSSVCAWRAPLLGGYGGRWSGRRKRTGEPQTSTPSPPQGKFFAKIFGTVAAIIFS